VLGELVHLHRLNVSNNRLSTFLDFQSRTTSAGTTSSAGSAGSSGSGSSKPDAAAAAAAAGNSGPRALREVDYSYNGLTSAGLQLPLLCRHKYLTAINLRGNRLTSAALEVLGAATPNVHSLDLSANELTDLSPLVRGPMAITTSGASPSPLSSTGSAAPAAAGSSSGVRLSRLLELNVSRNRVVSVACLSAGCWPALRTLDVTANPLQSAEGLQHLSQLIVVSVSKGSLERRSTAAQAVEGRACNSTGYRGNAVSSRREPSHILV
jgi:Leucine-rich repeat (LRR) protein